MLQSRAGIGNRTDRLLFGGRQVREVGAVVKLCGGVDESREELGGGGDVNAQPDEIDAPFPDEFAMVSLLELVGENGFVVKEMHEDRQATCRPAASEQHGLTTHETVLHSQRGFDEQRGHLEQRAVEFGDPLFGFCFLDLWFLSSSSWWWW